MDWPVATKFMKSLLAPKARHSHQSLGQRPRVMKIKKTLALKARFTSDTPVGSAPIESRFQRLFAWRFEFLGRCPRLDFEIAPTALRAAAGFLKSLQDVAQSPEWVSLYKRRPQWREYAREQGGWGISQREARSTKSTGAPTSSSASPAISSRSPVEAGNDSSSVTSKSTSLSGPPCPRAAEPNSSSRRIRCFSQNGSSRLCSSAKESMPTQGPASIPAPKALSNADLGHNQRNPIIPINQALKARLDPTDSFPTPKHTTRRNNAMPAKQSDS